MDKWRLGSFALGVFVTTILFTSLIFLQQSSTAQQIARAPKPAPALERFKAWSAGQNWENTFLIIDAGRERGIWAKYGLDPEWVHPTSGVGFAVEGKQKVEEGTKIGFLPAVEILLGRSNGVPVKLVAGFVGKAAGNRLYTSADSSIRAVKDLDGKKIGVPSLTNPEYRNTLLIANKFGIKPEIIVTGNVTGSIVALKLGKVDAFYSAVLSPLRLVDSGELRVLARLADFQPTTHVGASIWATEDLIEKNPELVQRFVKATLEIARILKENPAYAADVYQNRTSAPRDLAEKTISEILYAPSERGEGKDLVAAVRDSWQFAKQSSAIPADIDLRIEDAVDARFLP